MNSSFICSIDYFSLFFDYAMNQQLVLQHASLSAAHAIDYNIWLITKTSCIVILYRIVTTQHLDTDTVYQLYCTSLIAATYKHIAISEKLYVAVHSYV